MTYRRHSPTYRNGFTMYRKAVPTYRKPSPAYRSWHPLLTALPAIAVVRAASVEGNRQLHLLAQVLDAEVSEGADGENLLLPRLVDGLLILVLRTWIADQSGASTGWVGALRIPEVAQALSYIHQQPQKSWTVEELARRTGQSRATFNRRFVELVGEPPAAYLARWRMSLTAHLLLNSSLSLEEVASRVGYESSAALSKAFRRARGIAPGQFRLAALQAHRELGAGATRSGTRRMSDLDIHLSGQDAAAPARIP